MVVVAKKAVTPSRGSARLMVRRAPAVASIVSAPLAPCMCISINPGTTCHSGGSVMVLVLAAVEQFVVLLLRTDAFVVSIVFAVVVVDNEATECIFPSLMVIIPGCSLPSSA